MAMLRITSRERCRLTTTNFFSPDMGWLLFENAWPAEVAFPKGVLSCRLSQVTQRKIVTSAGTRVASLRQDHVERRGLTKLPSGWMGYAVSVVALSPRVLVLAHTSSNAQLRIRPTASEQAPDRWHKTCGDSSGSAQIASRPVVVAQPDVVDFV